MAYSDDDDDENDNAAGPVPIADTIVAEVRNYHAEKGQPMYVVGENGSLFSNPLVWWKAHVEKFHHVWLLASVVLAIPATSAPLEHVFSVAANIVNKKRVCLKSDMLIYLYF